MRPSPRDRAFPPDLRFQRFARDVLHPRLGRETLVGSAINISGVPKDIRSATAERGEHTEEVLRAYGYGDDEIADLRAKGAIG